MSCLTLIYLLQTALKEYHEVFGNDLYIAASRRYQGDDSKYLYRLAQLSITITNTNGGNK